MTAYYHYQLEKLLSELRLDPTRRRLALPSLRITRDYSPGALRSTLAEVLYQYCYHAPGRASSSPDLNLDISFESYLSQHNASTERFDDGWIVETLDQAGIAYAVKGNERQPLMAGEYVSTAPKYAPAQPGDVVRRLARAEHRDATSGFYYAFGQTLGEDSLALQTRVYFHLEARGAPHLLAWLTNVLNAYQVPFQFKCLNYPALYCRSDSAVLYLQKPLVSLVLHQLADGLAQLASYLRPAVPLFTRYLAPGIGFAESPPVATESFGSSRCGLIAQGIANAVEAQLPVSQYADQVWAVFEQVGLSRNEPYLNPGSCYPYQFPSVFAAAPSAAS